MSSVNAPASSGRSVFKGALQGTLLYSIPNIGQRLASICLLSIVTRVLTKDDFGMLSLLEQVSSVLGILLCSNVGTSLGYFYFENNSPEQRARVVGTTIVGSFCLGSLAAVLGWMGMGLIAKFIFRSEDALRYLPFVMITLPFVFVLEALFAWLRVEDRPVVFAQISLFRIGLTVAGIGVLVGVLKMRILAYLSTTLVTFVAVVAVQIWYLFRTMRPSVSWSLFLRIWRFSMPVTLSLIAMFVMNFGDQFVLRHYRSWGEVGIYSLAYRIGMLVSVAYSSYNYYWTAQVYQILRRDDADTVFARLVTYVLLMLSLVMVLMTVGAQVGLRILTAPEFRSAALLIPILAGANAMRAFGEFLLYRFMAAGKPGYRTYCDLASMMVCLALYFLWIPRFGMWGGAWATLGTFLFAVTLSVATTYRAKPYDVEGRRLLKLGFIVATILLAHYLLPSFSSLPAQIGRAIALIAFLPIGLWALRFPTLGELQLLRSAVERIAKYRYRTVSA